VTCKKKIKMKFFSLKNIMLFSALSMAVMLLVFIILAGLSFQLTLWAAYFTLLFLAIIFVLLLVQKKSMRESEMHFKRMEREMAYTYRNIEYSMSLNRYISPQVPLPHSRGWAASPDFLWIIIKYMIERNPRHILELGSGLSTLYIGYMLKKTGTGTLCSVEHSEPYYKEVLKTLATHELQSCVHMIYAPLEQTIVRGQGAIWYQPDLLVSDENSIDMLIIDGPPAVQGKQSRYPAIPLLHKKLAHNAIIIMDDYNRKSDRESVQEWLKEYPDIKMLEEVDTEKGAAILIKT
jgi:predicted O-methyltransferase YrrM